MRRPALAVIPLTALAAVLTLAGCSSSSDDSSGDTTSSSTTSTTTGESTTSSTASTSTTRSGPPTCTSSQLEAELGPSNAGAGQVYAPLILRNVGSSACQVKGFPGVSLLDSSGVQIGQPATREGAEGTEVLLQPGGAASATLHTTNQGIGPSCDPPSTQIKVFPPDQTEALTATATFTACGGFTVSTLVAGETGTT
jgi:hypothetical protein